MPFCLQASTLAGAVIVRAPLLAWADAGDEDAAPHPVPKLPGPCLRLLAGTVLAGRVDGRAARGQMPFYMRPFIDMRGIPAARYQDRNTAVVEAEVRWNYTPRWAAVGVMRAGRAWGRSTSFDDAAEQGGRRALPAGAQAGTTGRPRLCPRP